MVAVPQNAAADQGAILDACRADLAAWAAAQAPRGEVFVARDPIEPLLLLLGARSEGFRVVLSLGRDESADRENPALVINTTVQMVVQSGEGLRADRSILAWKGEFARAISAAERRNAVGTPGSQPSCSGMLEVARTAARAAARSASAGVA